MCRVAAQASACRQARDDATRPQDSLDVAAEWTHEAMTDVDMVALEPDPRSRMGASRFIGHSPSAGRVLS